jgi:hypothetical protein
MLWYELLWFIIPSLHDGLKPLKLVLGCTQDDLKFTVLLTQPPKLAVFDTFVTHPLLTEENGHLDTWTPRHLLFSVKIFPLKIISCPFPVLPTFGWAAHLSLPFISQHFLGLLDPVKWEEEGEDPTHLQWFQKERIKDMLRCPWGATAGSLSPDQAGNDL